MRRFPRSRRPRAPRRPGNLPAELDRFVGREPELEALRRRLEAHRLVTVTGAGGVGKSRYALHAVTTEQKRFCGGVWLVELAGLRDPGLLEHAVTEALGLADRPGRPPRSALMEHLASRELLLVLDGVEHLVAAAAPLVRALLRGAPGLRVLTTGRRPLGVTGEQILPLGPLAAPRPGSGPRSADAEAARLFADRAAAVLPGFALTEGNRESVAALCSRLDGLPLALELAAARLRSMSLEQLLDRLGDGFPALAGGDRGGPRHHRTLRTAVGWSHELCSPRERLLWARLSVFAGSFDVEAAEYVCSGDGLPAEEVWEVLGGLVEQSVVLREDSPLGARYRMLNTLRAYGGQWLDATDGADRLRPRLRDWCTGLVTWCELEWFGPRQPEITLLLDAELPNLGTALESALEEDDPRVPLQLAGALGFYWAGCGRLAEGRHWLERALELEPEPAETRDGARLRALGALGHVAALQGDTVAALSALHRCHEEAVRAGDEAAIARSLHHSGRLALFSDDLPRAERLLRAALEAFARLGELGSHVLLARAELALALALRADWAGATALCAQVRDVCADHGERGARGYALYVLGLAAWARGETEPARRLLREFLTGAHSVRDLAGTALALESLALLTVAEGSPEQAAELLGAADRVWRSVGPADFGSRHLGEPRRRCARQARMVLGAARYEECRERGARLAADAAVRRAAGAVAPLAPPAARGPLRLLRPLPRAVRPEVAE